MCHRREMGKYSKMVENNDMPLAFTMNLESYFRHFQHTGKRTEDREIWQKERKQVISLEMEIEKREKPAETTEECLRE